MAYRRIAVSLVIISLVLASCAGDDEDSGAVSLEEPIGAPESGIAYEAPSEGRPSVSIDPGPSVVKAASIEMEVVEDDLNSAAQSVIDLATSPKVGGFLVSSIVDSEDGLGTGRVVVEVPSSRFEQVVGDLEGIGEITRQQLEGQDLTPDFLSAQATVRQTRARIGSLLSRIDRTDDPAQRFELRQELATSRERLREVEDGKTFIEGQAAFSTIEVALMGEPAPAAPQRPALERALETAKDITVAIASGVVLAAGAVIPVGVLLLLLYGLGAVVIRRVRPRLGS